MNVICSALPCPPPPHVLHLPSGAPELGCGLGVPMRAEAAARWLHLLKVQASEQHWQLRNLLLLPPLDLATQNQVWTQRARAEWG